MIALAAALLALAGTAHADATVTIGSKLFSESVILGEIAAGTLRASGIAVKHQRGLGGTRLVWDALRRGAIDLYPEYTGTLTQEILADQKELGGNDLEQRLATRGIGMSRPLGFNNTYGLAVRPALARRLGLRRISDLREHPELRYGLTNEILSRRDGWPGLQAQYALAPQAVTGLDHELAYRGLAAGSIDVTDVYTTDPEIVTQSLVVLEDDRAFFPRYDAVLLYRLDLQPRAIAALRRLEGKISEHEMAAMNARAKVEKVPEEQVASAFLARTFGVAPTAAAPGRTQRLIQRTAEHLWLVVLSLGLAILIAIPLGILASRRPRTGQVVLAAVGVVQTIPSLALLVIMIPLLGIGTRPAIVALFLYSLLPIVRNTVAGLADVPPLLRESAEALGLTSGAILRLVELPLAQRSILAGIKSAAVINVGTATLGALVGAGGLGQPIFTGIRLADTALLLEGAIPASLLALTVQGLFEVIERLVVPRGLRLARN